MEDGEFIHRLAALLVMLFQLLHDRRLLHNSVVRLVFTNPMGQFAFACPHGEGIGVLLDGRDDHPLEVEEGGGTLQDAGDDPLDVLQPATATGEGVHRSQLSVLTTRLVLEDLPVKGQGERLGEVNAQLCQVTGQVLALHQAVHIAE